MSKSKIMAVIITLLFSAMIPHVISYVTIRNSCINSNEHPHKISKLHLIIGIILNMLLLFGFVNILSEVGGTVGFIRRFASAKMYYGDISVLAASVLLDCICSLIIPIIAEILYERGIGEISVSKRLVGITAVLFAIALIPAIIGFSVARKGNTCLEITGICRKAVVLTEKSNSDDTEEIVQGRYLITNTGVLTVNAKELWLSENIDDLRNAKISDIVLAPGETYEVTLSEDRRLNIKKDGGTVVYLSNDTGTVLSDVTVPVLKAEEWYKKTNGEWQILQNITEESVTVPAPRFSVQSGFYDDEFNLSISAEDGLTVYYTLDSSTPTEESTHYENAIRIYNRSSEPNVYRAIKNVTLDYLENDYTPKSPVDKAMVVRAVAVDRAGNVSDVVTETYFVGLDTYKDRDVISLVSDPDGLFSEETGIYVTGKEFEEQYANMRKTLSPEELKNQISSILYSDILNWNKTGTEWERRADFELFSDGKSEIKQPVGIKIQGHGSRQNYTKRFSVFSRKEYSGNEYFNDIIVGNSYSHSLYLRTCGNDAAFSMCQLFCDNRNLTTISCREVIVFLDGEIWGNYFLFDKYNEKNFAERFGLLNNNIVIVKNGEYTEKMDAGSNPYINIFTPNIKADTDEEFYDQYNQFVDIQSYIDFVCINHYMGNSDISDMGNFIVWHTIVPEDTSFGDGRWRFISYDMDDVMNVNGNQNAYECNTFSKVIYGYPIEKWRVWQLLCDNTVFQKQFTLSYMDMINTTFSERFVSYVLNEKGFYTDKRKEFFDKRPEYAIPQVAEELELSGKLGTVTLSSDREGSPITLNTITPELENGTWSGQYFTEYPVTVSAKEDGFVRFEVTANGKTTTYTESTIEVPVMEGGVGIRAIYQ